MSVDIPQPFRAKVEGPVGPVTVDGIPNNFDISIDKLPKISIGVDPLSVAVTELPKINLGIDPIKVGLDPIQIEPLQLNVAINQIPSVRAHVPADFTVGMKVLGLELFAVRLTGEAQIITEPFTPNPCEESAPVPPRPVLEALPPVDE
ncbi:MAG TPA: hypothetical protein VJT49_13940 [Amycolatopsis sp.]|uniref:hypothetical protein n=1 Tax=Amycolatopsis sp. TaxID=37632 RepID=UPI002B49D05E|nr:hypothetical protein [Amycolatopsis sp.]HKS46184.1 hypothetical protein [Amycolatopsis sp.]